MHPFVHFLLQMHRNPPARRLQSTQFNPPALKPHMLDPKDVLILHHAVHLESETTYFAFKGYPVGLHYRFNTSNVRSPMTKRTLSVVQWLGFSVVCAYVNLTWTNHQFRLRWFWLLDAICSSLINENWIIRGSGIDLTILWMYRKATSLYRRTNSTPLGAWQQQKIRL